MSTTRRAAATQLAHEARIAEQTRPLRDALRQTERYTDLRGRHWALVSMSAREALLVLALLERHAETLHRGELAEHLGHAIAARDDERHDPLEAGRRLASIDAAQWLRQTPLYRALTKRASQ